MSLKVRIRVPHVRKYSTSTVSNAASPMVMKIPVGNTALWIAHVRALENKRSDAIAKDQFAEMLSGKEGKEIYDYYARFQKMSARGNARMEERIMEEFSDAMAVRCRFYDELALSKSSHNCKQIVILASGLDSRAFRLPWSPHVHVFEVDRKEVLDWKMSKFNQMNALPTCEKHILIDADLTEESWPQKMKDKGFNPEAPSLWLVEGLMPYIPEEGVRKLLQKCSSLSPQGSSIGGDVPYIPSLLRKMPLFEEAKRQGNPFVLSANNPEKLFRESGWPNVKVNMKGDADVSYARFKTLGLNLPRWVPLPRTYLVQASK